MATVRMMAAVGRPATAAKGQVRGSSIGGTRYCDAIERAWVGSKQKQDQVAGRNTISNTSTPR